MFCWQKHHYQDDIFDKIEFTYDQIQLFFPPAARNIFGYMKKRNGCRSAINASKFFQKDTDQATVKSLLFVGDVDECSWISQVTLSANSRHDRLMNPLQVYCNKTIVYTHVTTNTVIPGRDCTQRVSWVGRKTSSFDTGTILNL